MANGFGGFDIARTGMKVSERALGVIGHNISNVNTEGYVRQQTMITSGPVQDSIDYQLGLGADIQQVRQLRNTFLDGIYRKELCSLGSWEARDKTYQDVQSVLGEPMWNGVQNIMNQFWDSWQELSKEPNSLATRALVRQRGDAIVQHFNHMGDQFSKMQSDLNSEIKVRIGEVNDISSRIAELNDEILARELPGDTANDLRDERNLLLDDLSKLINIDITETQDGQLDITIDGGYTIITKNESKKMVAGLIPDRGLFYAPMLEGISAEIPLTDGTLKGLIMSRGEVLGLEGSPENGTPNNKADITFAIDISDTSVDYIDKITTSIENSIEDLERRGLDYNLRLATFGSASSANVNYGDDTSAFITALHSVATDSFDTGNNFDDLVNELTSSTVYRDFANKYAIVFTPESIGGDGVAAVADASPLIDSLTNSEIKTSIITKTSYYSTGDIPEGETIGWESISEATGGEIYDIESMDFNVLMGNINKDINNDVNAEISEVPDSVDILPSVIKKLNAMVNVVLREVNYLHTNGRTYGGDTDLAEPFFVTVNDAYPLQMGNIKINESLADLDNIAASSSDASGDNTIALKIANLRNKEILKDVNGNTDSDSYYQNIILLVGTSGAEAERIMENQEKLVNSSDDYRKSIMNVSLDEEMANMMKYKFAYGASSRTINIMDNMLDVIINKMGG